MTRTSISLRALPVAREPDELDSKFQQLQHLRSSVVLRFKEVYLDRTPSVRGTPGMYK
jgi:hypothetical protein